jgi:hypothetical protein
MELCAVSILNAMRGPFLEMHRSGGVPILRGHHDIESAHDSIDDGDDLVAIRDSKCSSGAEVVLDINDQ